MPDSDFHRHQNIRSNPDRFRFLTPNGIVNLPIHFKFTYKSTNG